MNAIAVVLMNRDAQSPPCQRPVVQALYDIHGRAPWQDAGRPAPERRLPSAQEFRHGSESVKNNVRDYIQGRKDRDRRHMANTAEVAMPRPSIQ